MEFMILIIIYYIRNCRKTDSTQDKGGASPSSKRPVCLANRIRAPQKGDPAPKKEEGKKAHKRESKACNKQKLIKTCNKHQLSIHYIQLSTETVYLYKVFYEHLKVNIMASRRLLKKAVNSITEELIMEVIICNSYKDKKEDDQINEIVNKLIALNQSFIARINHMEPGNAKFFYKKFFEDFNQESKEIMQAAFETNKKE